MASISLRNLGVSAQEPLFTNLNLTIAEGDRLGLVAGNGGGKTTLLRCLMGDIEPGEGDIVRSRGLQIGFVMQDVPARLLALSFRDAVLDALPTDLHQTDTWRVDVVLDEFATPDDMRERSVKALSGGWQRIMLIARAWVSSPDILLLDEPTNHLDLDKLAQVEAWVNGLPRDVPLVIASHDRDFLDAVTNRTLFLRPGQSQLFAHPFSKARQSLAESDAAIEARFEKESRQAQQLVRQARKLTNVGINSGSDLLLKKSKQLRQRADDISQELQAAHQERSGDIRLGNSGTHAKVLVTLENVAVTTPDNAPLFHIDKLFVFQGDRIVLLGPNGAGKSQFIRLLHQAITVPDSVAGIRVSPSLVLGYTDQAMSQLPLANSPFGYITTGFDLGDQRTRTLLAGAGFAPEKQKRPIAELSFGQRARLALLGLRLAEPNFYLMDEPTNHVDIPGQEALEAEILAQAASCIIVSHDRRFVRNIGSRYWRIEGRRLKEVDI